MKQNDKITWVHISDLQFGKDRRDFRLYESLIRDIRHLNDEIPINIVFISGDLAWRGSGQYDDVCNFLDKLSHEIHINKDCIFCVPGNHDSRRTGNDSALINALKSSSDVEEFISSKYTELLNPKFDEYISFVKKNFGWADKLESTTLFFTENIIVNNIKIAVIGINSAWAENIYEGKVTIGENQLLEAFSKVDNADMTIALMHHPLVNVREFEKDGIDRILRDRCDFVLYGHGNQRIRMYSPYNETYFVSAGSIYENGHSVFSYNLGTVGLKKGEKSFFIFRKYDEIRGLWTADDFSNENGRIEIKLPLRITESVDDFIKKDSLLEKVDNYLVPYYGDKQEQIDSPKPPEYLIKAIENNGCILFAGAGASADAKLPTWAELVFGMTKMVEEVGEKNEKNEKEIQKLLDNKEYIVLADFCKEKLGDFDFSNYIKNKLDVSKKTSLTHGLLSRIPFKSVITTNFDCFIEKYRANSAVVYPDDLENSNNIDADQVNEIKYIYKIHGSYDKASSIVLTKSDFRNLLFKKAKYKHQLKQIFLNNVVLFYGYSFNDPDIDFLLQEIMAEYDGKTQKHYALIPDIDEIKREYLQREYNLRVIPYNTVNGSHIAANDFLKKIIESCDERSNLTTKVDRI